MFKCFLFSPRYYDSWWESCVGRDEEDIQRIIEKQLKKTERGSPGRGEGGGGGGDTGGYFVKSQWLQEETAVSRLARKASMDQTEKSVDRYLQAVLDRY